MGRPWGPGAEEAQVRRAGWGILATLGACAPGDGGGDAPIEVPFVDADAPGFFDVGVTTRAFVDARGKALTVDVWYPGVVPEGRAPDAYEEIPVAFAAHRDVPFDDRAGPRPVVAFSHSLGGIRFQSASLTEHLASHGYVVVAPDHPGNVLLSIDEANMATILLERPGDVASGVDALLAWSATEGDPLAGAARDDGRYAVVGHSFGAFTALLLGGADLDHAAASAHCEVEDAGGCRYLDRIDPEDLEGLELGDPRVAAVVPLAPGIAYAFADDPSGLAALPGTLVVGGSADGILAYETECAPVYEGLDAPKAFATWSDLGHYAAFSDLCHVFQGLFDCGGPAQGYAEGDPARAATAALVTAFLGQQVLGDARHGAFLEAVAAGRYDGLSWEADGLP